MTRQNPATLSISILLTTPRLALERGRRRRWIVSFLALSAYLLLAGPATAGGDGQAPIRTAKASEAVVPEPAVLCVDAYLSDIGQAVCNEISKSSNSHSTVTYGSQFPPGWLHLWPHDSEPGPIHEYYAHLGEQIAKTSSSIEIAGLALRGGYEHLARGLLELHQRGGSSERNKKPLVRFLFGEGSASSIYDKLTELLPGDEPWSFNLIVARVGNQGAALGWNHAKMGVRDTFEVITGSVELADETELAMIARCAPAASSKAYFEAVWGDLYEHIFLGRDCRSNNESFCKKSCFDDRCWKKVTPEPPFRTCLASPTPVFSLGRGKFYDAFFPYLDLSSDRAIYAALDTADEKISMMQRSFVFTGLRVERVYESIADAARRGVEVDMLIGDSGNFFPSAESVWLGMLAEIEDHFEAWGMSGPEKRAARALLRLGVYKTHAKYFSVDDQAFYIGSQNLYPGSHSDGEPPNLLPALYEHGLLVDDASRTLEVEEEIRGIWTELETDCDLDPAGCEILENPYLNDGTYFVTFSGSGSGSSGSGSCSVDFYLDIGQAIVSESTICYGTFNGDPIQVDLSVSAIVGPDGTLDGDITGHVIGTGFYDTAALSGTADGATFSAAFDGLELGITYSGSITGTAVD